MVHVSLTRLFDFLAKGQPLQPSDCIFVFAGKPERKIHGLWLWRQGLAKALILSVGRFEWRKFPELGLPEDGGLRQLVEATAPAERHFFVTLSGAGASCVRVAKRPLGTRSEALALREAVDREGYGSVLVVSTSVHLRRAALTLRRIFRDRPVEFTFVAVPEDRSSVRRADWWKSARSRNLVIPELLKLGCYWLFVRR